MSRQWGDASTATYSAVSAITYGQHVNVCLDDEGVTSSAHYWWIESDHPNVETFPAGRMLNGVWLNGWARNVTHAKRDVIRAARELARTLS